MTKKVYWLYYTFPNEMFEDHTELGISYVCYSDDFSLRKQLSNSLHTLPPCVQCKDGKNRIVVSAFRSLAELQMKAAINGWDLHEGREVFGDGVINDRELKYVYL